MWSRKSAVDPATKKEPYSRASATLRRIRIRRRINAAAAANDAAAVSTAAAAGTVSKSCATISQFERCDVVLSSRFSLGRGQAALEPIAEEAAAAAVTSRSLSRASSSRRTDSTRCTRALHSSQSSTELGELSTGEIFADNQAATSTPTTAMSRSVLAVAGSGTGSGSSPGLTNEPSVRLEQFSVAPITESGEPTTSSTIFNQSGEASPDGQPAGSSCSYSLSLAGNFLLDDPVIRGFLGDCTNISGSSGRSCATVSFAVPTRETGEVAEAAPTESESPQAELQDASKLCTAEERDWLSGNSFTSNKNAAASTASPLNSSVPFASANISVTAPPVRSVVRHQLLTRSSSLADAHNFTIGEVKSVRKKRQDRSRFQFTARCPSPRSKSNSSHRSGQQQQQQQQQQKQKQQQQKQQSHEEDQREGHSSSLQKPSDTASEMALILEVNRGGKRHSMSSNSNPILAEMEASTPATFGVSAASVTAAQSASAASFTPGRTVSAGSSTPAQSTGRDESDSSNQPSASPDELKQKQSDQTHQPARPNNVRISLTATTKEADGAKEYSGNLRGNADSQQPSSKDVGKTAGAGAGQQQQSAKVSTDCAALAAAIAANCCCSCPGGHQLPDYRARLSQLMRLCAPGCTVGSCTSTTAACCLQSCCCCGGGGGAYSRGSCCGGGGCSRGNCGASCVRSSCSSGGAGGCSASGFGGGGGGCSCCCQHHSNFQASCSKHCCRPAHRHQSGPAGCGCGSRRGGCSANCRSSCCSCCCCCSNNGCNVGSFRNCCSSSSGCISGGSSCCCCCSSTNRLGDLQSCFTPYRFPCQPLFDSVGQQEPELQKQQQQKTNPMQSTNCYTKFAPSWAANSIGGSTDLLTKSKAAAAAAAAAAAFPWLPERGDATTAATATVAAEKLVRTERP